jgi:hypothetical protein
LRPWSRAREVPETGRSEVNVSVGGGSQGRLGRGLGLVCSLYTSRSQGPFTRPSRAAPLQAIDYVGSRIRSIRRETWPSKPATSRPITSRFVKRANCPAFGSCWVPSPFRVRGTRRARASTGQRAAAFSTPCPKIAARWPPDSGAKPLWNPERGHRESTDRRIARASGFHLRGASPTTHRVLNCVLSRNPRSPMRGQWPFSDVS